MEKAQVQARLWVDGGVHMRGGLNGLVALNRAEGSRFTAVAVNYRTALSIEVTGEHNKGAAFGIGMAEFEPYPWIVFRQAVDDTLERFFVDTPSPCTRRLVIGMALRPGIGETEVILI